MRERVACFHLHSDADGETHLRHVELGLKQSAAGRARTLTDVPATTMGMGELLERKPDVGLHNAPRRQFLVVLRGALEVVTSLGEAQQLIPGDVLFADDIGSKGHISRDAGDDPLMLMTVGVEPAWDLPET